MGCLQGEEVCTDVRVNRFTERSPVVRVGVHRSACSWGRRLSDKEDMCIEALDTWLAYGLRGVLDSLRSRLRGGEIYT